MNILIILAFASSFLSFSIVIHALELSRRSAFTVSFALFVFCQGLWSFTYMMLYQSTEAADIQFWYALSGFGWIPIHALGLHFILVFTGRQRLLSKCWIYPVLYAPPAILLYRHLTGTLITAELGVGAYGVYQVPALHSPWFWAFFAYTVVSVVIRTTLLLRFRTKAGTSPSGKHAGVLAVADAVTVLLILVSNYVVPASGMADVPSLGAVIIVILPLAGWYIIRKQRFLSYNLYFRFHDRARSSMSTVYREIFNLESIFDAVENGIVLVDTQYQVFRTNRVLDRWIDGAPEIGSHACYRILYGRHAPCPLCPLGLFDTDGRATRDTIEFPNGRIVNRTIFPVREASGRTSGAMEILRDVTEERQTERERHYLLHAVENTPTQIVIADTEGYTIYANRAFRAAVALSMDEIRGRAFWTYYEPTNSQSKTEEIRSAVARSATWQGEIVARGTDGADFPGRIAVIPMVDEDRSYVVAYVVDVSEAERAQRMRDQVERTIRHDLKSPLTAILGMSELLMHEIPSGPTRELVEGVRDGADRMRQIINSSFDLHKMEDGTYQLRPEREDAALIVRAAERELAGLAEKCSVSVELFVDGRAEAERAVPILCDRVHLQRMVSNLLKNAIEASPGGGPVQIDIRTGDSLTIAVHNGGTVPDELRKSIFRPYVTAGKTDGTGLGLFSAKLIAEAHGGSISYTSTDSGGTTFVATLPTRQDRISNTMVVPCRQTRKRVWPTDLARTR